MAIAVGSLLLAGLPFQQAQAVPSSTTQSIMAVLKSQGNYVIDQTNT